MRLAIAGFLHESNTFNPVTAGREAFAAHGLACGEEMAREWAEAHHEVGGFFEGVATAGHQAVPLGVAWATPSGPVEHSFFEEWCGHLTNALVSSRADGLLLALHGAMVTTECRDADAEALARLRARVGDGFPIAVTFDLHANLSPRIASLTQLATSYRTNPHLDQRQTGLRANFFLLRQLRGEVRPKLAIRKPETLINIMRQDSSEGPFAEVLALCRGLERRPGALVVDFLPGFPYADVEQMGPSILAVAEEQALADELAEEASEAVWSRRERFQAELPDKAEAVRRAIASQRPPVALVETGDNVGGGAPGDSTELLGELLRQRAERWVVMLHAPEAVRQCQPGATARLVVGTPPVEVTGRVVRLHPGTYVEAEPRHGGKRTNHMGPTALLEVGEGGLLALTTLRHPPFSLTALTCLGVEPSRMRILVVKAAIAYRAAYAPVMGEVIEAGTPGVTSAILRAFSYRHAPRLYPLDAPPV
jgi:microcystin degradation protein MlrC